MRVSLFHTRHFFLSFVSLALAVGCYLLCVRAFVQFLIYIREKIKIIHKRHIERTSERVSVCVCVRACVCARLYKQAHLLDSALV